MGRKKKVREVEKEYRTKIKYKCPKRGWVEEEVVIKRYKSQEKDPEEKYGYSFLEEPETQE